MYINKQGYLARRGYNKSISRSWWLIKDDSRACGISVPKSFVGKRIRLKVIIEEVDDNEKNRI